LSYLIETYNLTKKFPVVKRYRDLFFHPFRRKDITALHNINLHVKNGELFGLLGPNGAGKTTLIKILCTLILPTEGEAFVNGLEVTRKGKDIRRKIGYVIGDERSFYWRLTGRQNLKFFAKLNNIPNSEVMERIERLLDFMELASDADRPFKDYSTGMRKKLAIARGLLTEPEILFMDEPTNGLDPVIAQNLNTLVKEKLVEEEKKTVVFATHNLQDAEELCNRIAIIHKGEIRMSGSVGGIKMKYKQGNKYVMKLKGANKDLFSKINSIPMVKHVKSKNSYEDINQVEIETESGNDNITKVIKEIIDNGGTVQSFYEKETSLKDLFSRIIDRQ
jgi:ABC-2 type transport system ATP-binding protein